AHAQLVRGLVVLVDVERRDRELAGVLAGDLLDHRLHRLARATPFGLELEQDRDRSVQHLLAKRRVGDGGDGLVAMLMTLVGIEAWWGFAHGSDSGSRGWDSSRSTMRHAPTRSNRPCRCRRLMLSIVPDRDRRWLLPTGRMAPPGDSCGFARLEHA